MNTVQYTGGHRQTPAPTGRTWALEVAARAASDLTQPLAPTPELDAVHAAWRDGYDHGYRAGHADGAAGRRAQQLHTLAVARRDAAWPALEGAES